MKNLPTRILILNAVQPDVPLTALVNCATILGKGRAHPFMYATAMQVLETIAHASLSATSLIFVGAGFFFCLFLFCFKLLPSVLYPLYFTIM